MFLSILLSVRKLKSKNKTKKLNPFINIKKDKTFTTGHWAIGPLGHWAIGPLGHWAFGPLGQRKQFKQSI